MPRLHDEILRTVLYYDIWHYPLNATELFNFLPVNSITLDEFKQYLQEYGAGDLVREHEGFYFAGNKTKVVVTRRESKERHARWMWRMARLSTHIIKRFPFVRGVFVSGDLSKNVTNRNSDIDFFVVTEPHRLWIARTLLILFKKVFLLNRKKFFCLNYFATTDHLELDEHNVYLATEIAHLKPLFNSALFCKYLEANAWIREYFPNFDINLISLPKVNERQSLIQKVLEFPFLFLPSNAIDRWLLRSMERIWTRRYPEFDDQTRDKIFRCTECESRAYVGNFQDKVLALYEQRLREFGVTE
jgi:hypothetical protein